MGGHRRRPPQRLADARGTVTGDRRGGPRRWVVAALFVALLAAFAAGLWGTVLRPPAYELRGEVAARPAANLLLLRHEASAALGMAAMDLMPVFADPALLDAAALRPGDRVRAAVRPRGDELHLLRLEKLP